MTAGCRKTNLARCLSDEISRHRIRQTPEKSLKGGEEVEGVWALEDNVLQQIFYVQSADRKQSNFKYAAVQGGKFEFSILLI